METITYADLAKRLNACKLFNKFPELDTEWLEGIQNGSIYQHPESDEENYEDWKEVYQWYLIDQSDAEYIMRNSDEIIIYSDVIDEYVWAITHYGTSWDYVSLEFGPKEESTT